MSRCGYRNGTIPIELSFRPWSVVPALHWCQVTDYKNFINCTKPSPPYPCAYLGQNGLSFILAFYSIIFCWTVSSYSFISGWLSFIGNVWRVFYIFFLTISNLKLLISFLECNFTSVPTSLREIQDSQALSSQLLKNEPHL